MLTAPPQPSKADIAWFAGLFEGEGCICLTRITGKSKTHSPRLYLGMTDKDIIDRIPPLFGGTVDGPFRGNYRVASNAKDIWRWRVSSWRDVIRIGALIRPRLGIRRTTQLDRVLSYAPDKIWGQVSPVLSLRRKSRAS